VLEIILDLPFGFPMNNIISLEAQCKDGVRADGVASLIVSAGERGLLGVGFENMIRSWVI